MTETETRAGRLVCPTCGKDVAVNRDGSLRKHPCVDAEVLTDTTTTTVLDPDGTVVRELATKPELVSTDEPAGGCAVEGCGRVPVAGGLCGAHYATHRGLARKG